MAGTLLNRMSKWFGFHNHFPFSLDLLFPSRDKQSTPSLATRYYRPCPIGPSAAQEVFWTLDLVELILLGAYGPHDGSTLSGAQLRQLCALQHLNRASYFCINLCYKLRRLMWLDWPSIAQEPTLRDLTWNPLLEISGAGVFRGVDYQRLGGYTRKPGLWASMQISRPKCSMIYITGPVWEGGVKYIQDEYRFNPGGITLGQLCEFPSIQQEWSLHVGQVPWVNVYFEEAARNFYDKDARGFCGLEALQRRKLKRKAEESKTQAAFKRTKRRRIVQGATKTAIPQHIPNVSGLLSPTTLQIYASR